MHPAWLENLKHILEQAKADQETVCQIRLDGDTLKAIQLAQQCTQCGVCIVLTGYEGTISKMLYLILTCPESTESVNFTASLTEKVLYHYPPTLTINQPSVPADTEPAQVLQFRRKT